MVVRRDESAAASSSGVDEVGSLRQKSYIGCHHQLRRGGEKTCFVAWLQERRGEERISNGV